MKKILISLFFVICVSHLVAQQQPTYWPTKAGDATNTYSTNITVGFGTTLTGATQNKWTLIKFVAANTGAATLNINSTGAKALRKYSSGSWVALASGDIQANDILEVKFDNSGDFWRVVLNSTPGGVSAFNGRTGSVSPAPNDYAAVSVSASAGGGLSGTNVAQQLTELDDEKASNALPINNQTGNYTLANSDRFLTVGMNSASARDLTVPNNSTVSIAVGSTFWIDQLGTAAFSLVAAGGVTLNVEAGYSLTSRGQYSSVILKKTATNVWTVYGTECASCVETRLAFSCSDLTTAITTGNSKAYFDLGAAFTITAVRATLLTAQSSGTILTIDINDTGTTILSTKLTIDNSETSSATAATPAVISDTAIAANGRLTIDFDAVGTGGVGVIVEIVGYYN